MQFERIFHQLESSIKIRRGGGMVDAMVSNTIGLTPVRVRVPPPVQEIGIKY